MVGRSQFFTPGHIARSLSWLSKLWLEVVLWPKLSRAGALFTGSRSAAQERPAAGRPDTLP
jgi:hypothetical protein